MNFGGLYFIVLLYVAFALAIGFFVLKFAVKEEGWVKTTGLICGWVIIALCAILTIGGGVGVYNMSKNPMPCPMMQMMQQKMPMMQGQKTGGACNIENLRNK